MSFLEIYRNLEDIAVLNEEETRKHFEFFNEKYKYFLPEDGEVYSQFAEVAKVFYVHEDQFQYRRYDIKTPYNMFKKAYKFMIFFGDSDIETSLARYDEFKLTHQQDGESSPASVNKALNMSFRLLYCNDFAMPIFNLEAWKEKLLEFGPEVITGIMDLPAIEKHLGKVPETLAEFKESQPYAIYKRSNENPNLAKLAFEYKMFEREFNSILNNIAKDSLVEHPELPDIVIDLGARVPEYFIPSHNPMDEKLSLKPRHKDSYNSFEEIDSDFYNGWYLVKLPKTDPRYILKSADMDNSVITTAVNPRPNGIYVVIKSAAEKLFDPHNIDWDNLESDGHNIQAFYYLNQGSNNQFFLASDFMTIKSNSAFITRILGDHLSQILPSMEAIYSQYFSDGEMSTIRHIDYVPDELYLLRKQLFSTMLKKEYSFAPARKLVSTISQGKKILDLGEEYVRSLRDHDKYLSGFVIDHCEDTEEIKLLHREMAELEDLDHQKFELIFKLASKSFVTSNIGYRDIVVLPTDIIEFLNEQNFIKYNIKVEDLINGALNMEAVKKNFIKICMNPFAEEPSIAEFLENISEEALDILLKCDDLTKAFRYINPMDILDLEPAILEQIFSDRASTLYTYGVKWQDLIASNDINFIKQNILMSYLRLAMDGVGFPEEEILELSSAISKFTEDQLEFFDENECYLYQMVKFVSNHEDADIHTLKRKVLEEIYGGFQIVEEGFLSHITDEMVEALDMDEATHFVNFGYASLETLINLPPALIPHATHYSMINIYNRMNTNIEELFLSQDPGEAIELLKAEHDLRYDANGRERELPLEEVPQPLEADLGLAGDDAIA